MVDTQFHGGNSRLPGGTMSRFKSRHREPNRDHATLRDNHPALIEGRTVFPKSVRTPTQDRGVLISGVNNAKVGAYVLKGPWKGFPIYTLSLEERATCPSSCDLLSACYGNAMPLARRWRYGPELIEALDRDIPRKSREHAVHGGFVVRLHILGDFPDLPYVDAWQRWMAQNPGLHVFGYTHHPPASDLGKALGRLNGVYPSRWSMRFSVPPDTLLAPMQATTIWRQARGRVEEGIVCPASSEDTETCGSCGLCWSEAAAQDRIVFLGHGMGRRGPGMPKTAEPAIARAVDDIAKLADQVSTDREFADVLEREIVSLERRLVYARQLLGEYRRKE